MCQWLMTAALSELLNKVEFTLNCTESKRVALRATLSAPRAKWHWTFGITFTSWFQKILVESSVAKASVTVSLTVGTCAFACVHMCAYTFMSLFSIEGYFWGSNFEPNFRASEFEHKTCLFCFCKIKFCCKMHMQNFCTEVTILPWSSCSSRFFWRGEKVEKEIRSL